MYVFCPSSKEKEEISHNDGFLKLDGSMAL